MIPGAIYLLCALMSALCAWLLARGFRRSRGRLLLWAALCFAGLTAENMLLFADLVLFPQIDLSLWRQLLGCAAVAQLLIGLIWESAT